MNLQTKLIHEIINDDFGCSQCAMNDTCPVYNGSASRMQSDESLLSKAMLRCSLTSRSNGTDAPEAKRTELLCIAYTYKHVAERIFNRLAEMPWNEALDTIQVAERVFCKLAAMPLDELIYTILGQKKANQKKHPQE